MRISTFVISLGLTLLFEIPFAYLFGVRGRHDLKLAVLVNVLTNPAVVLLKAMGLPILLLEGAAIAVEAFWYHQCGENIRRPVLLAVCANAFSYSIGVLLNRIF